MKKLFSYQEVLDDVVMNGVAEVGDNAIEAQKQAYLENWKKKRIAKFFSSFIEVQIMQYLRRQRELLLPKLGTWNILNKFFKGVERIKKLWRQFELLQIENTKSINKYFTKIISLTNQIKNNGDEMEDLAILEKIL